MDIGQSAGRASLDLMTEDEIHQTHLYWQRRLPLWGERDCLPFSFIACSSAESILFACSPGVDMRRHIIWYIPTTFIYPCLFYLPRCLGNADVRHQFDQFLLVGHEIRRDFAIPDVGKSIPVVVVVLVVLVPNRRHGLHIGRRLFMGGQELVSHMRRKSVPGHERNASYRSTPQIGPALRPRSLVPTHAVLVPHRVLMPVCVFPLGQLDMFLHARGGCGRGAN